MAKIAHNMVANIAREMAGEFYDGAAMVDNDFFKHYPSVDKFIAREWGRFVPIARAQLAKMLTMDKYSDHMKEQIAEALIMDRCLYQGRAATYAERLN